VPGYRNSEYFRWKDTLIHTDGDDITVISTGQKLPIATGICVFQLPYPAPFLPSMTPETTCRPRFVSPRQPGIHQQARLIVLSCARKGGGSSNKTTLVQATKSILNKESFELFIRGEPELPALARPPSALAMGVGRNRRTVAPSAGIFSGERLQRIPC